MRIQRILTVKLRNLYIIAIFLLNLWVVFAQGSEVPDDWDLVRPKDDAMYKYYVGRSSYRSSKAEARIEAREFAKDDAISENFGFDTKSSTDSYESLNRSTVIKRVEQTSKSVHIEGFEVIRDKYEQQSGLYEATVLMRYPKTEIEKEKKRLATLGKVFGPVLGMSVIGAISNPARQGSIEFISEPSRASIEIDGLHYGVTPATIHGIAIGERKITLDHPDYEPREEMAIVLPNETMKLQMKLNKSIGYLSIQTTPSGASIYIHDKLIGPSPISNLEIEAGLSHSIRVEHPEAETQSHVITLSRKESRSIDVALIMKPASITVNSDPKGAAIILDSKQVGVTNSGRSVSVPAGSITLEFTKPGYESKTLDVRTYGGKLTQLPTIELLKIDVAKKLREEKEAREKAEADRIEREQAEKALEDAEYEVFLAAHPKLYVRVGIGWSGNTYSNKGPTQYASGIDSNNNYIGNLGLRTSLTYRFIRHLGLRTQFSFLYGDQFDYTKNPDKLNEGPKSTTKDFITRNQAAELEVALPIYVLPQFYLAPSIGQITNRLNIKTRSFDARGKGTWTKQKSDRVHQTSKGLAIGYEADQSNGSKFYIELSVKKYSDDTQSRGNVVYGGHLGLLFGW